MLKLFRLIQPTQSSFRSILLWRVLLLTIPVLCLLQYATYRKARSSLLETARHNLIESATEKSDRLEHTINSLKYQLQTASENPILQSGDRAKISPYLQALVPRFAPSVVCLQLQDITNKKVISSTCMSEAIAPLDPEKLSPKPSTQSSTTVDVQLILPALVEDSSQYPVEQRNQLDLMMTAPVFRGSGEPAYILVMETLVPTMLSTAYTEKPKSLSGYTVILTQDGQIIAHGDRRRIGRNINEESNSELQERLKTIIRNATAGQKNFLHLPLFDQSSKEVITGYTAIPSPITPEIHNEKWIILAVTPMDNALSGLQEIRQTLINLILGLVGANLIASFILARTLATPIEQLGKYAQSVECSVAPEPIPQKFDIREFNQLAQTLNSMVERLTNWAEELEEAWQEAKSANQLKSEFLASISHELRTPLNAIIGSVRLVKDGFCDDREEEREFLQQVDNAAIHLLSIIDDILDIAKIEAGKLSLDLQPVNLTEILRTVIEIETALLQEKGLYIVYKNDQLEATEPLVIQADPDKLKQVFLNVIGNAIKFTEKGGVTVETRIVYPVIEKELNGQSLEKQVIVSIKDTGIGIAPASQSKLFQPFVMVDGTRTRKFEGTGLGLAISRNLVEMMAGQISLYSEGEGKGTTVEVVLPLIDIKQWERSQALKLQ